jgi:hypothetical protein
VAWITERIRETVRANNDLMIDETVKYVIARVAELQSEIGSLRADITLLQAIIKGNVSKIGSRDAA